MDKIPNVEWRLPPANTGWDGEMSLLSAVTAHAGYRGSMMSLCKNVHDFDRGPIAVESDIQCKTCVHEVRHILLARLGASPRKPKDDDDSDPHAEDFERALRDGTTIAKMTRLSCATTIFSREKKLELLL